jgi:transposase InsO family protein
MEAMSLVEVGKAIVDAFTKFIQLYVIKSTKTRYTVAALRELIKSFGVPKRIISDRKTSFTSNEFKVFTDQFGIAHHLNEVGMPRGNRQVERYNRTILNSLATMG